MGIGGAEVAGGVWEREQVSEIRGSLVVKGFVSEEKDFEVNAVFDGQPMEILKDWSDVLSGWSVSQQAGSRVLNILKFVELFEWEAVKEAIAIIKSGGDEGVNEDFSGREGEEWTEPGYVF